MARQPSQRKHPNAAALLAPGLQANDVRKRERSCAREIPLPQALEGLLAHLADQQTKGFQRLDSSEAANALKLLARVSRFSLRTSICVTLEEGSGRPWMEQGLERSHDVPFVVQALARSSGKVKSSGTTGWAYRMGSVTPSQVLQR